MNIGDTGIHALLGTLIAVEGSGAFQPFVIATCGYPVYHTKFGNEMFAGLLLYLSVHLLDHFLRASPSFRALCFFRRCSSACF